MSERIDHIDAIYKRMVGGELSTSQGVDAAMSYLDTLSRDEQEQMKLELLEKLVGLLPEGLMEPEYRGAPIVVDGVSPQEVALWNDIRAFDGFSMALNPVIMNPQVQKLWDEYKDKPRLLSWNHPLSSMYFPHDDTIYLTDSDTFKENGFEDNELKRYSVLFHEMIHSSGAAKRLNRLVPGQGTDSGTRAATLEEVIADMGALMLMDIAGILTPKAWDIVNEHTLKFAQRFLRIEKKNIMAVRREALPLAKAAVEYITGKPYVGRLGKFVRGSDEPKD